MCILFKLFFISIKKKMPLFSLVNLQATPENSSLPSSLDFIFKKTKKHSLSFLNIALFPLTSHCLVRICSEQCLEICITSNFCVCLPLYNLLLIVFFNCKSLWIKASAKWINVNVSTCMYNILDMDIFLTKKHKFLQETFIHPWSRVRHILLWIYALYFMSFGLLKKQQQKNT